LNGFLASEATAGACDYGDFACQVSHESSP
jgi:hypothetical protein